MYVQLKEVTDLLAADNIEILNDYFNDEWGGSDKPLTAVSLKQEVAQGGKAKALLNKYTKVKNDYNLTTDEINYKEEQFSKLISHGISRLERYVSNFAPLSVLSL